MHCCCQSTDPSARQGFACCRQTARAMKQPHLHSRSQRESFVVRSGWEVARHIPSSARVTAQVLSSSMPQAQSMTDQNASGCFIFIVGSQRKIRFNTQQTKCHPVHIFGVHGMRASCRRSVASSRRKILRFYKLAFMRSFSRHQQTMAANQI